MSGVALLVQTAIAAYLILGEPFYGRWEYQRLLRAVDRGLSARTRFYRNLVALEWGLVVLALLTLWLRGEPFAAFGLRYEPSGSHVPGTGVLGGALIGLLGSVILGFVSPQYRAQMQRQLEPVRAMLPATTGERWWYALVSITAGVCEEILFRGFMFAYLTDIAPGLPLLAVLVITSLIFGMAHLYQGWSGVLGTGLLGAMLGGLYLVTGSLLWSVLLHALMDMRVLTLPLQQAKSPS